MARVTLASFCALTGSALALSAYCSNTRVEARTEAVPTLNSFVLPTSTSATSDDLISIFVRCERDTKGLLPTHERPPAVKKLGSDLSAHKRVPTEGCAVVTFRLKADGSVQHTDIFSQYPPDRGLGPRAAALLQATAFAPPDDPATEFVIQVKFDLK